MNNILSLHSLKVKESVTLGARSTKSMNCNKVVALVGLVVKNKNISDKMSYNY